MIAIAALRLKPGDPVWWRARGQEHTGTVVEMRYVAGKVIRVLVDGYRGRVAMSYRRLHHVSVAVAAEQLEMPEMQHAPGRLLKLAMPPVQARAVPPPAPVEQEGLFRC